jgi:hypothetical protein
LSRIVGQEKGYLLLYLTMELEVTIPQKEGQICKIINPLDDESPDDVYIVAEDPQPYGPDDNIYVVNLKDLQRNISTPLLVQQTAIPKNELAVIANDIDSYIQSWNAVKPD